MVRQINEESQYINNEVITMGMRCTVMNREDSDAGDIKWRNNDRGVLAHVLGELKSTTRWARNELGMNNWEVKRRVG